MRKLCFFVIAVSLFFSPSVGADHPTAGFGSNQAGPITAISATPLPKGMWSAGIRVEYVPFDEFSDSELLAFAESQEAVDSTKYLLSPFLGVAYGITDNLTLSFRLPYVDRQDIREGELEDGVPEVHSHGNSHGIGDITFFSQYGFLELVSARVETALLAGLKIPSGTTDAKDQNGIVFEAEHQPGSGSWDPLIGIAVTKRFNGASVDANLLYTFSTEGAQETDLGDLLNYNLAVSYRLNGREHHDEGSQHDHAETHSHVAWDFVLEANGEWRQKQTIDGIADSHSGGSLLYLAPGIRMTLAGAWSFSFSAGFPVWQDLNGFQHESRVRLITGIVRSF
ncbi:transporter [bacterium]|nr:transporter [bacterium]